MQFVSISSIKAVYIGSEFPSLMYVANYYYGGLISQPTEHVCGFLLYDDVIGARRKVFIIIFPKDSYFKFVFIIINCLQLAFNSPWVLLKKQ